MVRQVLFTASHQDGRDNEVVFVHQPCLYGMGREGGDFDPEAVRRTKMVAGCDITVAGPSATIERRLSLCSQQLPGRHRSEAITAYAVAAFEIH